MIVLVNTQKDLKYNQIPLNSRWRKDYFQEEEDSTDLSQASSSDEEEKDIEARVSFLRFF